MEEKRLQELLQEAAKVHRFTPGDFIYGETPGKRPRLNYLRVWLYTEVRARRYAAYYGLPIDGEVETRADVRRTYREFKQQMVEAEDFKDQCLLKHAETGGVQ